jgi:HTH-type transcriptional repressor of NAD biosynthesis genes
MPEETITLPRPSIPTLAWYGVSWASEPEPAPKEPEDPDKGISPTVPKIAPADFGPRQEVGRGKGLVVGRFLPPHRGHQFVCDFARKFASSLTIAVHASVGDPYSVYERMAWLREMFPTAKVLEVSPTAPSALVATIVKKVGPIDFVFGSEAHGQDLAKAIGARFIAVDPQRKVVPISASQIRLDPMTHWAFIPPTVRPRFVLRVCLIGPESTGKTTLAQKLAEHYKTVCVPEFARTLTDDGRANWTPADVQTIARAQLAAEEALARQANRVLICDTSVLQVKLWSQRLFGIAPPMVEELARKPRHDLCILVDPGVPFVGDSARNQPAERAAFADWCTQAVKARNFPISWRVKGSWDARFAEACKAVDHLIDRKFRQVNSVY